MLEMFCTHQEKQTIAKLSGLVVECRSAVLKTWVKPQMWSPGIFKLGLHQQKLSSLFDVKLEAALYSVFYAEASKRSKTSLN